MKTIRHFLTVLLFALALFFARALFKNGSHPTADSSSDFISSFYSHSNSEKLTQHLSKAVWQKINGRNDLSNEGSLQRNLIYRIKVPSHWLRHDPLPDQSLIDTTLPLCKFLVQENEQKIHITFHNFPTLQIEERIPPEAQVLRWKRQFDRLDVETVHITPQAFSGFSGLLLEAHGMQKGKSLSLLAWSMQLAKEHYRQLSRAKTDEERKIFKQMRADFTVKVIGDQEFIEREKDQIIAAVRTLELIDEIPMQR